MRCLDLFAGGCNGFGLAAKWMGWQTVACVEIDEWNQKLLKQNFPESEIYGDIREFNRSEAAKYRGRIDLITGGFPCQPFSSAGKRKGTEDDRYLWPEMLKSIRIIQPEYVVGENVVGLTTMDDGRTFDGILASLEDEGYTVESFILPACGVGAWHRRNRIWIVAYLSRIRDRRETEKLARGVGLEQNTLVRPNGEEDTNRTQPSSQDATYDSSQGLPKSRQTRIEELREEKRERIYNRPQFANWWKSEPGVGRVVSRIPNRAHRIKALGNSVVPQVAYEIYQAIEKTMI